MAGKYRLFKNPYTVELEGLESDTTYCVGLRGCESIEETPTGVRVTWAREEDGARHRRSVLFLQGILDSGWEAERAPAVNVRVSGGLPSLEPPKPTTHDAPKKPPKKRTKRGKKGDSGGG